MNRLFLILIITTLFLSAPLLAQGPPAGTGPPSGVGPPSATVLVDCAAGDSITEALNTPADELTIEIDGFCSEDFVIQRDFVILRGKNGNPNLDGIHSATPGIIIAGTGLQEIGQSVVWIRGAQAIRFENLFIGEGQANRSGVAATMNSIVTISNCRIENNLGYGVAAGSSSLFVVDSTVRGNSSFGGLSTNGGLLHVSDSVLLDNGGGLLSVSNGQIIMSGGSLNGAIFSLRNSGIDLGGGELLGVEQTALSGIALNLIGGDSSVHAFGGSTLQGLTLVMDFSNFVLREGSTLDGFLSCGAGGDAFCETPATDVTGSNCSQCLPP